MKKLWIIMILICCVATGLTITSQFLIRDIDGKAFIYDRLDILAVGDSNLYSAFSPQLYYQLYQKKSYVMATANQSIDKTYQYLSEFLLHTHPQIILFETNPLYSSHNPTQSQETSLNLLSTDNHVQQMYTKKKRKDYLDEYGFYESRQIIPGLYFNHMKKTSEMFVIPEITKMYFEKIVDICQQYHIQLILLSVPSAIDWSMAKHNYVAFLAQNKNLPYIDLNLSKQVHINWLFDSRDGGIHLNNNGAIKVTRLLGQILEK
ncbi:hypothetical protein [Candidatus Stoquefichus sp. SB1]|uniref:hypothetical protein n=1 Tax=Candidatus Stoquefichus sp. SB1 TaxID=1658109 RepID=UPI00067F1F4E|nr:hypothetical protein [Candidatus Stoquefichus sp. SB1]